MNRLAVGYLYRKLGVKLEPSHSYRVTVSYENPSADTIHAGGMGVVGGVFLPSAPWPATDSTDALYVLDRKHYLREVSGTLATIMAQANPPAVVAKKSAAPKKKVD